MGTLGAGELCMRRHGRTAALVFGGTRDMLAELKALGLARIDTLALGETPVTETAAFGNTDGIGRRVVLTVLAAGGSSVPAAWTAGAWRAEARRCRGQDRRADRRVAKSEPIRRHAEATAILRRRRVGRLARAEPRRTWPASACSISRGAATTPDPARRRTNDALAEGRPGRWPC